jgi:outer membrane protein assembly factor BamB/tetratricopeptide (TPR) repeat protein
MAILRRTRSLLATMSGFVLLVLLAGAARSQTRDIVEKPAPPTAPGPTVIVTFPGDTRLRQKLEAARDYVKAKDWDQAVRVLQDLLDLKEDQFLPPSTPPALGKPTTHSGSVRGEAARLVAGLPPKGLEVYNAVHGPRARALLKEATERDDTQLLAQVVQRYVWTEAGAEAAERLGTYHLDRGNAALAGRCFAALLSRPDADRLPPLTLYKAAIACRLANDTAREDEAWKALTARAPDGLAVGGEVRDLERLRAAAARLPAEPPGRGDWPLFRAGPARTGRGDGDVPLLEPAWSVPTLHTAKATNWIDQGIEAQARANRVLLPGFHPIAVPGRVVYRSHSGVHALDPATGRELWKAASPLALDAIADRASTAVTVQHWLAQPSYVGNYAPLPVESALLGCLSCDGQRVYAVEDLAVPPPPEITSPAQFGLPPTGGPAALVRALAANQLRALDLSTGAVLWEKGGRGAGALCDSFFLGAPLPVAGRLYAMVEKNSEVRLICLDPASGAVAWEQRLGVALSSVLLDPYRRLRGVQMTYSGGLLLCPTDAGALFAFDPFTRSLAWAHLYPSNKQPAAEGMVVVPTNFAGAWRESAPAVAGGKVVFTPIDSEQVHCVNLVDGKPVWQAGQRGAAYLAGVFGDRVLLVGAGGARALSLADGRDAWVRSLGVPSGQGAASGNVYYLPLKAANETGRPGVVALDTASGRVLALAQSRGGEAPGNLVFSRGEVVSQTAKTLTAYPQLKARLRHVEELLAGDPRNWRGLSERGSLRLDQGDVPGALADLRAALDASPTGETRREAHARLHEGLRQAVQRDFAAGEKYLAELEASCRVPVPDGATAEQRALLDDERLRREANSLLVLARGREGQGRVADALAAYAGLYGRAERVRGTWGGPEVGWLPAAKPAATPSVRTAAPPRPELWVHGQVAALVNGAAGAQKAAIEKEVDRQWRAIPAGASVDDVGRFVRLFGTVGGAGPEARLAYAERLGRGQFLEAELHLLALQRQREAPQLAARALEALARLLTEIGQPEDALHYYRQLGEEFGTARVRDGKTGADFLKGLALDPRFLPLLDDPWAGQKYRTAEVRTLSPARGQMIWMEPEDEAPPCLRRVRLAFDLSAGALKLFDRNTGAELWSRTVGVGNLRQTLRAAGPQAWIPYRTEGHLAVVTLGHMAFGIDLLERRLLWARDLGDGPSAAYFAQPGVTTDDRGRMSVQYQDGYLQSLGRMAAIQPAGVCATVRGKAVVLDPLRGDTLWAVALTDPLADLFADDASVYLVEGYSQGAPVLQRAVSLQGGAVRSLTPLRINPADPLQAVGRNLLVSPSALDRHRGRLTLYDAPTGKDLWNLPLPAGAVVARSEVAHLTATVARDGTLHVYDLHRRAELFKGSIDADHLRRVHEARLFQDRSHYYLMLNRELRGQDGVAGAAVPNAVGGLRTLPAHGALYAFHRGGTLHWWTEVKTQHLILEQFEESPLLLFSAVVQRANPKSPAPVFTVTALDKQTGKVVRRPADFEPITSPVHMVQLNPAAGTVDLITRHWKMRHTVTD